MKIPRSEVCRIGQLCAGERARENRRLYKCYDHEDDDGGLLLFGLPYRGGGDFDAATISTNSLTPSDVEDGEGRGSRGNDGRLQAVVATRLYGVPFAEYLNNVVELSFS